MGCSTSTPAVMEAPTEEPPRHSLSAASRKDANANANTGADSKNEQRTEDDSNNKSYPASEAFTIPLDDGAAPTSVAATANVVKKPPKRIQELMQQAEKAEPSVNLAELEKKLNDAELRRKEFLQQKVENVQKTTQAMMRASVAATAPELEPETQELEEKGKVNVKDELKDSATYASEIKAKALDDDSKCELLNSTWKS